MPVAPYMRTFLFVVPTLNALAAQNEDIVQLLLFAAARLQQEISRAPQGNFAATILSVEPDTQGWPNLMALFAPELLAHISIAELPEPATPNLALPTHKAAYHFFEYLKTQTFDEVHALDRHGLLYYPTQARELGLYCLQTLLAVHVTGGTIFRYEAEDQLLDNMAALMDDLLERGSVARADVVYVHDRKAWAWYADKVKLAKHTQVSDLAWSEAKPGASTDVAVDTEKPTAILYYGALSAAGGLPLFCDAVNRLLPKLAKPVEIYFVGAAQAIGGMDAVSYIRLRSAKWGVPVTIQRDLSLADELALLGQPRAVVVCNTMRREGLRSRLLASSGLPMLQITTAETPHGVNTEVCSANPNHLAAALSRLLVSPVQRPAALAHSLTELWCAGRAQLMSKPKSRSVLPLAGVQQAGPKVSVCVTHFSRPQKLRLALASLQAQSYQNFEVIVVDDGSPDPAVQRELKKIRQEIQPLGWRLLVQENRYLGAARNYGASQATGDYLLFMDDDNVAMPNEISTLVAVALRTQSDIVTSFFNAFESEESLTSDEAPGLRLTPFGAADPTLGILTNCYGDANALYTRAIFDKVGGFTEDYGITHEDWEFFCRAALEGAQIVCVPEPLFWYRVDQGGMFRGQATQLHKNANLRRHIRPYLAKLPYYQAQLVQLAQGLTAELPVITVGATTRTAGPRRLRTVADPLPYGRVAIIMRTKDRPLLLRRAVRSVLDQTFRDWLLVIVNDGGNPEAVELVVNEVAEELTGRLLVLHHPTPLGMQTAANAGLTQCDSDYLIIHDDDDSWQPTFLARTVSHLDEQGWNPKVGGVVTWSMIVIEELMADGTIKLHQHYVMNDKLQTLSLVELAGENRFPPIAFLFHRAALEAIGPFQEEYSVLGDWDFHLRFLQHYNIDVIPAPLANYHHRTQSTSGVYGNSVHAQCDLHRVKRNQFQNKILREELTASHGISVGQLLALGDLQKTVSEQQSQEFQRLHEYIWTIEQKVNYVSEHTYNFIHDFQALHVNNQTLDQKVTMLTERVYAQTKSKRGRNLARNGDFRVWPGLKPARQGPQGQYTFVELCPGFVLCHEGSQMTYRVERRHWRADGYTLPWGKSYLHLENEGNPPQEKWLRIECILPSVAAFSGRTIALSALCRMSGAQPWMVVGGRYDLGNGRTLPWPEQAFSLKSDFTHWSCVLHCPSIQPTELGRGQQARLWLRLPYEQAFTFDLTNFQVEMGAQPTEFAYNNQRSLPERLAGLFHKVKAYARLGELLRQPGQVRMTMRAER